jgi:hypothetical protein
LNLGATMESSEVTVTYLNTGNALEMSSVVDQDSINLDPDPAFQVNLEPDPDPGFDDQIFKSFLEQNCNLLIPRPP